MQLLLTSSGLSTENIIKTLFSLLNKPEKEIKVQIMAVNNPNWDIKEYFNMDKQKLISKGVKPEIIYENELGEKKPPNLQSIDVLLMLGGNTYHYMHYIRKHGFEAKIRDFFWMEVEFMLDVALVPSLWVLMLKMLSIGVILTPMILGLMIPRD